MKDFHAHLLPGIDDGSTGVSMSVRMLDIWRDQGWIDEICATPHFYAEYTTPERFIRSRENAYEALMAEIDGKPGYPPIRLGAEVRFFDGISTAEKLPELCLQGTNLLLLEMPFTTWTDRMLWEVTEIRRRGLMPVAAHIERYLRFNPAGTIRRFMDQDVLIQCNADFFLSRRTSGKALRMLKEERIHFIGSDAHNTDTRSPNIAAALEHIRKKLGNDAIDRLVVLCNLIGASEDVFL